MNLDNTNLSFRISSGLKNIIGKDLISDKYIAIFELVKNAYDAGAKKVVVSFYEDKSDGNIIRIVDDGKGMDYNDIINKWLFVAYSEKNKRNQKPDYRDELKREYAGAKGVGRFSCDRLGSKLQLVTTKKGDKVSHVVDVDWNSFEKNDTDEFINIPVTYSTTNSKEDECGTAIIIKDLREKWDRDAFLKLRRSLMKLISPEIENSENPFDIFLDVPSENKSDAVVREKYENGTEAEKSKINLERDIVNGKIVNDLLERIHFKTTNINVDISPDGKIIKTALIDRGKTVFSVAEKNRRYGLLSNISISLMYLNQSAKVNFTRQMGGVSSKAYGSVFVYKNGFRINPYGDPGQDFFGIDVRKQQGYARYLGTREIMGKILIHGNNDGFIETSSRAHGFINTPSVEMLQDFFLEKALKVLERYVINLINWGEPLKSEGNRVIEVEEVSDAILNQFLNTISNDDIVSINYDIDLINKTKGTSTDKSDRNLARLEAVADKTKNNELHSIVKDIKKKNETIEAQISNLEKENLEQKTQLTKIGQETKIKQKQIDSLEAATNQNVQNLLNGYHTVYTLTDTENRHLNKLKDSITAESINIDKVLDTVGALLKINQKIRKLSDLALHGNLNLKQAGANDLYAYLCEYVKTDLVLQGLDYKVECNKKEAVCKYDVTSIGIILDNIASNSLKAGATKLDISIEDSDEQVCISFTDNGIGLAPDLDPDLLFEWGTTDNVKQKGYGIGLYHIKTLVKEMKGKTSIDLTYVGGFRLLVYLKK